MTTETLVNIYNDDSSTPLFSAVAFFSVNPGQRTRMIGHPVENGQKMFDNKVIEPSRVTVACGLYRDQTAEIEALYAMLRNRQFSFYTIKTVHDTRKHLSLVSVLGRQNAEKPRTIDFSLEFQEVLFVEPQNAKQQDPANATTQTK